jgi:hypothetical protein
MLNF